MKKIISLLTLVITSGVMTFSGVAQSTQKIGLLEKPVPVSTVDDIEGFYGDRIELNRNRYLKDFPIDQYVDFIVKRQHTEWTWTQAEQHGKWIESAYLSAIQGEDSELMKKAQEILAKMINSQEPSGYVGATAASYRSESRPTRGMDAYELYFVFHAFMTVYEETGNSDALKAAEKLADYYLAHFGPGKCEFWPSNLRAPENRHKVLAGYSDFAGHSVHYSWEGSLLCDPIARLYEITKKKKYLDWSLWVVNNIDKWSGWDSYSRLDSVADGNLGVNKLQPYVHSHTFHMNFLGFLRLYRITGDQSYLRKVKGAWNDIYNRQMYITGGVSVAEHYEHGHVKPLSGNIVETCATMSWMQLTQDLLELTADTKYADAMERLMINHVFAAQDAHTGVCRYHTAPNGSKPDGYFHGPDCCTASGHRIISLLPTFLYAENGKEFYINQYLSSKYNGTDFAFHITGNYPESENICIDVTSPKAITKSLNLRVPAWCNAPQVKLNGKEVENVKPGEYLTLNKKWQKGDKIEIYFPMEEKWIMRENHSKYNSYTLPGGEIMYTEEPTTEIPYAFARGPMIYSVDMVWNGHLNNDDLNLERDIRIDINKVPEKCAKPSQNILGPVYQTSAYYKGSEVKVILTPFTNIGQWYRDNQSMPQPWSDMFSYGIWLYPNK